ncbi:MAG: hypothetical protein ACRCWO_12335 [Bosea sp. (in: a-proteobacteria)]
MHHHHTHHAVAGKLTWSLVRLSALSRLAMAAALLTPALATIYWMTRA